MDALRKSLKGEPNPQPAAKAKKAKRVPGQKETLLPIAGKGGNVAASTERKNAAPKASRSSARARKAG